MRPLIVLSEDPHLPRTMQANLLTQYLLGAEVHLLPSSEIRAEAGPRFGLAHVMEELAERVRREGGRPYVLPTSSVPLATLGFVAAAIELSEQLEALRISRASLYMTSTGSTQAGLLIGAAALGEPWSVVGVACAPAHAPERNVCRLANGAAELLGLPHRVAESEVLNHDYSGGGYGIVDEGAQEALELLARSEGVLLDPVYSAKGMAGLIDHIRSGRLGVDDVVVFVHTGGTPTTFAYADRLAGSADYFASTGTAQLQEDSA